MDDPLNAPSLKIAWSKKKYNEIEQAISAKLDRELVETVMATVRDVMNFDPNQSTYNARVRAQTYQYRKSKRASAAAK